MSGLPKRTVEELATLYRREPTLRDIFVEGTDDRALIEWYLVNRTAAKVSVREIDLVEVPADLVLKHGLTVGNRGRVIALAKELSEQLVDGRSVTCVADADFDLLLGTVHDCPLLVFSDYACVEMYFFNERVLRKLFAVYLGRPADHVPRMMTDLASVLQRLFIIRLANVTLNLGIEWLTCERQCTKSGDAVDFDEPEYVRRYLQKGSCAAEEDRFNAEIARHAQSLAADPRHQINGHDLCTLLAWYLRQIVNDNRRKKLIAEGILERALFACIELDQLDSEPMFRTILARVTAR